jgi:DNA polymerase
MVVAQDFADEDGFLAHGGWPGERVQTNLRLVKLVGEAGVTIRPPKRGESADELFFTNAVLCMKQGGMRADVPGSCYEQCGQRFLRPQIDIVSPKVVVTLGWGAAAAVCRAYGRELPAKLADPNASPIPLTGSTKLMPLYHPMASRLREDQVADWRRVGELLAA